MKPRTGLSESPSDQHNRYQRRYFERSVKRTMVPTESRYLRKHVAAALALARYCPGERALEVGCGMGRYTLLLAQQSVRVEGLDLSPVLLDRLRAYNAGRFDIPLHCADLQTVSPEQLGSFDLVLGFFALHHVDSLEGGFAALARLLRRGGRAVFVEPNPFNPLYYLQILITPGMTWHGERGILQMRAGRVFRAMTAGGLRPSATARFGFFPPWLANRSWAAPLETALERVPLWRPFLPFQLFRAER